MSTPFGSEYASTNDVFIIHSFSLILGQCVRRINPDCIHEYCMLEIFPMKIDCITFKFEVKITDYANNLALV